MRRWNGWGDDAVTSHVPDGAGGLLKRIVGPGTPRPDAGLAEVLAAVPSSRVPEHRLVTSDPLDRVRHARGQSLPDWIALRSGRLGWLPDGVAHPAGDDDVRELLTWAARSGVRLIPYGGGTSVAGHLTPASDIGPTITIALDRMAAVHAIDAEGGLATFGAGITGPELEAALRSEGRTLGHFPQSFEYATLGGWIATRSSGQESRGYGRIEDLFAGGHLEAPDGPLDLPPFPASAAGPDIRALVLGSEGRLGVITRAVVRTAPIPERDAWPAWFLPDLERGIETVRELAGTRIPLSMIRLQTAAETMTTLALAGRARRVGLLVRYLRLRGLGPERCLLLLAASGRREVVSAALGAAASVVRRHGGIAAPGSIGRAWRNERFRSAYLRNALWDAGYAVDTLETAAPWDRLPGLVATVAPGLRRGLEGDGERVHAFSHLSHVYPSGSSLYTTYLFRLGDGPDETLRRWTILKRAASEAIVAGGGTISHQHGVGRDHAPYLGAEKGALGMAALRSAVATFDPNGVMAPGALLGDE